MKRLVLLLTTLALVALTGGWTSLGDLTALEVFDRAEPEGVYRVGDHLVQAEPELEPAMVDHAAQVFQSVYDTCLEESQGRVWLAVIPGKHAFLAGDRPSVDYQALTAELVDRAPFLNPIDLAGVLTLDNYYRTDAHWRQETLGAVAALLAETMGAAAPTAGETRVFTEAFRGNYLRAADLPLAGDTLRYVTSPATEAAAVTAIDLMGGLRGGMVYDFSAAWGRDPYDLFLSGAQGLLVVEDPTAKTDRELVIFRDSFASSLTPLLLGSYRSITLVDLRYLPSQLLGEYVDFHGQDVLFLYSSLLLNNSLSLR